MDYDRKEKNMGNTVRRKSTRSNLFLTLLTLGLLFSFTSVSFAGTSMIYKGLNMPLVFVTGVYQLSIGPLDVGDYSKIRVNAFGNSGSGTILVQLAIVDAKGNLLGLLDSFTLDFGTSDGITATRTYDIPGKLVKIYLQSLNEDYASVVVFGR
jgi:hypothetical protein